MTSALLGIGTALPPHCLTRMQAARWGARVLAEHPTAGRLASRLLDRSGIETRWTCVPDFVHPESTTMLGVRSPTTSARMQAFREHAPALAETACRRALASAGVEPHEIRHLVLVTCTGFFAPGPDIELIDRLGLSPSVERTLVGFMGCCAAFNGLRVARNAIAADPDAKALVVCVELCTLHFRPDPDPDTMIAHTLFGDGASAAVLGRDEGDSLVRLGASSTQVAPGTRGDMGWQIGDEGFRMSLSTYVPKILGARIADFVAPLSRDARSWCVHPGGRAILDHVEEALALPADAIASSRAVLRDIGNVSSATILFVLERELARLAEGDAGVMLAFGPGLTIEGCAFTRGARSAAPAATLESAVAG